MIRPVQSILREWTMDVIAAAGRIQLVMP